MVAVYHNTVYTCVMCKVCLLTTATNPFKNTLYTVYVQCFPQSVCEDEGGIGVHVHVHTFVPCFMTGNVQ